MRKIVIAIMVVFTIALAGGLYNTLAHLDTVEKKTTDYSDVMHFHGEMPDIVLSPVTIPIY
jgi:hypothetical protein